ncbi:MAG: flagellar basal body P-ring formation chaperone FlgA [Polaromonas sp.]
MKLPTCLSLPWQHAVTWAMLVAMAGYAPAALSAAPLPLTGPAREVIEHFLTTQTAGLPGKISISMDTPRSGALPPCDALEAFLPRGAQLRGRVSVGVRCTAGQPWTRYVQAHIAIVGTYYVAARQIEAGQTLTPADTTTREADLTTLPASVVVDANQLGGVTALNRIALGAPIRRELLRGVSVVQQGQNTKVVTHGAGFTISTEGKAMTDAAAGAVVQVKIEGGQLISGIVRPDGTVERAN